MHFLGGDADLGRHTKLAAIGKPSGRIMVDRRRIDFGEEAQGVVFILRQDGFAVMRAVSCDVS